MKFNFSVSHKNGKVLVSESDWNKVLQALFNAGYDIKQSFTPTRDSVRWEVYVILVIAILTLGIIIGQLTAGR